MKFKIILSIATILIAFTGCSSILHPYVNRVGNRDLSGFKTYYIVPNPRDEQGFYKKIMSELSASGIKTELVDNTHKPSSRDCVVTYDFYWNIHSRGVGGGAPGGIMTGFSWQWSSLAYFKLYLREPETDFPIAKSEILNVSHKFKEPDAVIKAAVTVVLNAAPAADNS